MLDDAIAYASERVEQAGGGREHRVAWWSAIAMLRSLVSSPRAAAKTLTTRSVAAIARTPRRPMSSVPRWPVTWWTPTS